MILPASCKNLKKACKTLKKGGLVIYPTETSYGIGCDATNENAIKKIYKIKKRGKKPLPVIFADLKMARKYIVINSQSERLVKKFMPGPLTLVAKKKNLPDALSKDTVAFRISSNRLATDLVRKFKKPITATSANISSEEPLYKTKDVEKKFSGKVDIIIDAGNLKKNKPSTIYDTVKEKVLRKGKITEKEIIVFNSSGLSLTENSCN